MHTIKWMPLQSCNHLPNFGQSQLAEYESGRNGSHCIYHWVNFDSRNTVQEIYFLHSVSQEIAFQKAIQWTHSTNKTLISQLFNGQSILTDSGSARWMFQKFQITTQAIELRHIGQGWKKLIFLLHLFFYSIYFLIHSIYHTCTKPL